MLAFAEPPHEWRCQHRRSEDQSVRRDLIVSYGTSVPWAGEHGDRREACDALIGPSGCGKSTFLRSLNRMNDWCWAAGCRATCASTANHLWPGRGPSGGAAALGMVFRIDPFPKTIFDNVPRLRIADEGPRRDAGRWNARWSSGTVDRSQGSSGEKQWDCQAANSNDCALPALWPWSRGFAHG